MQNIKEYVAEKKEMLKHEISSCATKLKMVVVRVGDDPASVKYTNNKIKDCLEVGITAELLKFPEDISEEALLAQIHRLNTDDTVTGYLVQLPLPKHISEEKVNLAYFIIQIGNIEARNKKLFNWSIVSKKLRHFQLER